MRTARPFRVSLTADFQENGQPRYRDIGLRLFESAPRIEVRSLAVHEPELSPEHLADTDGVIVLTPRVTARSLSQASRLLAIGRFGVGYDSVDVAACTAADVLLYITSGAVDRPVAEATVGWMLALSHRMLIKDRLVREARWGERSQYMGSELRDRTLGVIGFGGIGRSVVRLLSGWGMNPPLVFDPYLSAEAARQAGVRSVDLQTLLTESDFVSLHCPLNVSTRGMLGPRELGLMKPTAFLINTARGGIVDEEALFEALSQRQIAGAALDCFATEPLTAAPRFAELETVLLAPHCIAWTDELFRDIGQMACQGMIDLAEGKTPRGIVNPEVLSRPGFQAKWNAAR